MTDLPFGRGGSPLQNLIVRGITETKISAIQCEAGLDTGPVYLKRPLSLEGTAQEIYSRANKVVESMILDILLHSPVPLSQEGEVVDFKRRVPEDGNMEALERWAGHIRYGNP